MRKLPILTVLAALTLALGSATAQARDKYRDGINPNTAHGAWYYRSDTQCVVRHEGGWTSVNPAGYYGRFQMDISFQRETAYGKWAYRTYGTANRWPPAVQVYHAHEVWLYAGWHRWPTYYRFGCGG